MIVTIHPPNEDPRVAPGPGDLASLGPGSTVTVTGPHNPDRDFGRWTGALGSAVLRGASITRA